MNSRFHCISEIFRQSTENLIIAILLAIPPLELLISDPYVRLSDAIFFAVCSLAVHHYFTMLTRRIVLQKS